MRDIKFRAYSKAWKKIYKVHELKWALDDIYAEIYDPKDNDYKWMRSSIMNLMQYTGLKDKNGKEIYEGDIVRKKKTQWHGENTGYITRKIEYRETNGFIGFNISGNRWEVIGNIYENPELAEKL